MGRLRGGLLLRGVLLVWGVYWITGVQGWNGTHASTQAKGVADEGSGNGGMLAGSSEISSLRKLRLHSNGEKEALGQNKTITPNATRRAGKLLVKFFGYSRGSGLNKHETHMEDNKTVTGVPNSDTSRFRGGQGVNSTTHNDDKKSMSDIIKKGSAIFSKIRVLISARKLYKALASNPGNLNSQTVIPKVKALERAWKSNVLNFTEDSRAVLSKISTIGDKLLQQIKNVSQPHQNQSAIQSESAHVLDSNSSDHVFDSNSSDHVFDSNEHKSRAQNVSSESLSHVNKTRHHRIGHNLQKKSYYGSIYDDDDDRDDSYDDYDDARGFMDESRSIRGGFGRPPEDEGLGGLLGGRERIMDTGQMNAVRRGFRGRDEDLYDEPDDYDDDYDDQYDDYGDENYSDRHFSPQRRPRLRRPQHQLRIPLEAPARNLGGEFIPQQTERQAQGDTRALKPENSSQTPPLPSRPAVAPPPIPQPAVPDPPLQPLEPPAAILRPPPDNTAPDPPSVIFVPPQKVSIFPSKNAAAFARGISNPNTAGSFIESHRVAPMSIPEPNSPPPPRPRPRPLLPRPRPARNYFHPRFPFMHPFHRPFGRHSEMNLNPSFDSSPSYHEAGRSLRPQKSPLDTLPSFDLSSSYRDEGASRHSLIGDSPLDTSPLSSVPKTPDYYSSDASPLTRNYYPSDLPSKSGYDHAQDWNSLPLSSERSSSYRMPEHSFMHSDTGWGQARDAGWGQDPDTGWGRDAVTGRGHDPNTGWGQDQGIPPELGWGQQAHREAEQQRQQANDMSLASRLLKFSADMDQKNFGLK